MSAPAPGSATLPLAPATTTALDLTRALAAQAVLLGHAFDFFNVYSFLGQPDPPPQLQRLAVVVFFLLSGLLIARSLHRHALDRGSTFAHYLADRAARIYSGLLPALLFIAAVDALPFELFELDYFDGDTSLANWFANLLHLQDYPGLDTVPFGSGVPLWTLSIEWWLYVLAGAFVLGWQSRRRSLAAFALALVLLPISAMSVVHNLLGGAGHGIALTWLLGAAVYLISTVVHRRYRNPPGPTPWLLAATATALLSVHYSSSLPAEHPAKAFDRGVAVGLALSFLFFVMGMQRHGETELPRSLRLGTRSLAGFSYTLYLTHFSVLTVFYEWRGDVDDRWLLILAIVTCNLVAAALAQVGEAQRERLRAWLPPARAHTAPPARRRSISASS